MAKTAEQELRTVLKKESSSFDERFPIVRASTLSKKDSFLNHEPQTRKQTYIKRLIIKGIEVGLKDFRRAAMDPSLDKDGNIIYKEGETPAVGKTPEFWYEELKKFMPEKNSRMGTLLQYAAFLGLLIKYLIEEKGYEVAEAWKAVCDDSRELGHLSNSDNAKQYTYEKTGSRKIWDFYDLANTCKIVELDSSNYDVTLVSNNYRTHNGGGSLATVYAFEIVDIINFLCGVGWLVLDV